MDKKIYISHIYSQDSCVISIYDVIIAASKCPQRPKEHSFSVTVPSFLASLPHLMLKTHRGAVTIWCPPLSSHAAYDKADSKATPPEQRPQEMPEKRPRGSSKHMRGPDLQ